MQVIDVQSEAHSLLQAFVMEWRNAKDLDQASVMLFNLCRALNVTTDMPIALGYREIKYGTASIAVSVRGVRVAGAEVKHN